MKRRFSREGKCIDGLGGGPWSWLQRSRAQCETELGAFGGVQESGVFADGEAVGHAGYVVSDGAGSAVGAAGCFGGGGDGAVFGGEEVDIVEEGLEQLAHHA